jgi:RNA polymerase sigma factor (TIGR02999 family)
MERQGQNVFESEAEFLMAAVRNMRQYLIDYARQYLTQKRSGQKIPLDTLDLAGPENPDWIALDDALKRLELSNPQLAQLVEFRCFGGLTFAEIGEVFHIAPGTARAKWKLAKTWLLRDLGDATQ